MNVVDLRVSEQFYLSDVKMNSSDERVAIWRKWKILTDYMAGEDVPNPRGLYLSVHNEYLLGAHPKQTSFKFACLERGSLQRKIFGSYTSSKFFYSDEVYIRKVDDENRILFSTYALYLSDDGLNFHLIGGIVFALNLETGYGTSNDVFQLLTPVEFQKELASAGYNHNSDICIKLNTVYGAEIEYNPNSTHYSTYYKPY